MVRTCRRAWAERCEQTRFPEDDLKVHVGLIMNRRWRAGWEATPMLTVVHNTDSTNTNKGSAGRSLLDAIVCDGAREMLAAALKAGVPAYIDAHCHLVDENGHRLVVRNSFHDKRTALAAAGEVPVPAPRVNDKQTDPGSGERQRFSSFPDYAPTPP